MISVCVSEARKLSGYAGACEVAPVIKDSNLGESIRSV
jgi:hypothetical protein